MTFPFIKDVDISIPNKKLTAFSLLFLNKFNFALRVATQVALFILIGFMLPGTGREGWGGGGRVFLVNSSRLVKFRIELGMNATGGRANHLNGSYCCFLQY